MAAGNIRPISGNLDTVLLKTSTTAVKEGDGLKTIAATAATADGDAVDFVAAADIDAGKFGAHYYEGVFNGLAAAGVNFAPGDKIVVATASAATFDAGTATNPVTGRVINTDPATAGRFDFFFLGFFNEVRGTV
jgi:predicted RecA/RadA family phage recombinase